MKVRHAVSLADYTSLRVGGPAETLIELDTKDDLAAELKKHQLPVWVLGGATNCLISDKGLPGTVIIDHGGSITQLSPTRLKADSGVVWDDFVKKAIGLGLYGLEFSSGIPGRMGAAVVGNIAAYGHGVSQRLVSATIFDPANGSVTEWDNQDFAFDYRYSVLQKPANHQLVVLDATFELSKEPTGKLEYDSAVKVAELMGLKTDSLADRRAIIMETRKRAGSLLKDNAQGPWTAGSFFKNPLVNEEQVQAIIAYEEAGINREQLLRQNKIHGGSKVRVSAAHVLLAAGFKRGQTWNQVRLHPDHILKIENVGGATAQEIYEVIQEILKTVKRRLNITLEPEVQIMGEFNGRL